jgi:hypothetical protein
MQMSRILKAYCFAVAIALPLPAFAEDYILKIYGDVGSNGVENAWTFSRADLEELPRESITTSTIWTEGQQVFEGVSLRLLLSHVEAKEGDIRAMALNDYAVTIPTSDAVSDGPIVAYKRNDEYMSIRDKGPLWIIYPYDANEAYRSEDVFSRSIWQLNRLEIVAQ